jgi:hypothetical protein
MFCPACGFEYAQKTKFCKRCGENLGVAGEPCSPRMPRSRIAGMFWAIAVFSVVGLIAVFKEYDHLAGSGLRGDELMAPFMLGLLFIGGVAGFLIRMLSRMITAHQKAEPKVIVEKHIIREAPPAQLGSPTDPLQQAVSLPSVVEHTTRSMAHVYRESLTRE